MDNEYNSASVSKYPDAHRDRRVNYTFGAGRRVCVGQRFVESTTMKHFAKLVWVFDIKATGKIPLNTWNAWTDGILTRPKDLNVAFGLRAEGRRNLLRAHGRKRMRFYNSLNSRSLVLR